MSTMTDVQVRKMRVIFSEPNCFKLFIRKSAQDIMDARLAIERNDFAIYDREEQNGKNISR